MHSSRLQRKNRPIQLFESGVKYSMFDGIDRVFMETYRLNKDEFTFLTKNLTDEETNYFFTNELTCFKEKREALIMLQKYMDLFYK